MSRRIDTSNPESLSDEDRKYLQDRGLIGSQQLLDYEARIRAAENALLGRTSRGTLAQRIAAQEESRRPVERVIFVVVDVPYEKWKVEDLREECRARDLFDEG